MSRNVLLTGGNGGIGLEMARALARHGDRVTLTGRDPEKLARAETIVGDEAAGPAPATAALDIGDFDAVRDFAGRFAAEQPPIDVLVLNAGLYTRKLHRLPNGYEAMIGVMHLGHFLLTNLLLERLLAAAAPRVVVTSSVAHKTGKIDFDAFTDPGRHRIGFSGYAQAKLANLLFARELAARYGERGLTAHAFHPGAVATGIWRELPQPIPWLADKFMVTPAQGADTGIWLATDGPENDGNGEYFVQRQHARSSRAGRDTELARRLWSESERMVGLA